MSSGSPCKCSTNNTQCTDNLLLHIIHLNILYYDYGFFFADEPSYESQWYLIFFNITKTTSNSTIKISWSEFRYRTIHKNVKWLVLLGISENKIKVFWLTQVLIKRRSCLSSEMLCQHNVENLNRVFIFTFLF